MAEQGKGDDYFLNNLNFENQADMFYQIIKLTSNIYGIMDDLKSFRQLLLMQFCSLEYSDEFGVFDFSSSNDQKDRMKEYNSINHENFLNHIPG